jgi:hypothetical protein
MRWRWPPENSWGEALGVDRLQADQTQHLNDPLVALVTITDAMDQQTLGNAVANRRPRIERRERVLENDLRLGAERCQSRTVKGGDILAAKPDAA